tara:strand:+ start:4800 stop:4946 length:147 start_codon:yes stop_codon:yes gene_type:complete
MSQKLVAFGFLFFLFFVLSSCYTVTRPVPCPGLVDVELDSKEISSSIR